MVIMDAQKVRIKRNEAQGSFIIRILKQQSLYQTRFWQNKLDKERPQYYGGDESYESQDNHFDIDNLPEHPKRGH